MGSLELGAWGEFWAWDFVQACLRGYPPRAVKAKGPRNPALRYLRFIGRYAAAALRV